MDRLKGRKAVISGATGGIGRIACRRFCEEGASVIGLDLTVDAGLLFERELKEDGFNFRFMRCDVSSARDVASAATYAKETFGGIEILFNNAGIILGKHLLETTEDEWEHIMDVNLKSVFLMTQAFAPLMKGRSGSIINVSSAGGVVAVASMSAYGAAKAGVIMFSKVAAVDLGPEIRVNAICPGVIDTPMPRAFVSKFPQAEQEAVFQHLKDNTILKRFGRPEEVASLALYLASDESSLMTGTAISIDGGATAT